MVVVLQALPVNVCMYQPIYVYAGMFLHISETKRTVVSNTVTFHFKKQNLQSCSSRRPELKLLKI